MAELIRRFNLREGLNPEDDRLPKYLHQPQKDTGKVISEEELGRMKKDYFLLQGRDENGNPPAVDHGI